MTNFHFCHIILLSLSLIGCNEPHETQRQIGLPNKAKLTLDSLRNALVDDEELGWVKLQDGRYEDTVRQIDLTLFEQFASADFDSDGYEEAICLVGANTGGSGTFMTLDLFHNDHGSAVQAGSYEMGDRVGPDSVIVVADTINLYFQTRGPDDGMAKDGSIHVHKKLKLLKDKLVELN